jgi:transposase
MSQDSKYKRRSFTDEFKRKAVKLIVNQGHSLWAAAKAVGVGEGRLRLRHRQFAPNPVTAAEGASLTELRAEVQRLRW